MIFNAQDINNLTFLQVQITCFQSFNEGSSQSRREIEMEIVNNNDSLLMNNFEVSTIYNNHKI